MPATVSELQTKAKDSINGTVSLLIASNLALQAEAGLHDLTRRKGSLGRVVEWGLTGTSGDNLSQTDFVDITGSDGCDIKAVIIVPTTKATQHTVPGLPGYRFKENLRLTSIHYEEIQQQTLRTSSVWCKRKNLVVLLRQGNTAALEDYIVASVGVIDLTLQEDAMARDFEYFKTECAAGRAHMLSSSKHQPTEILKLYSSGNGANRRSYRDAAGNVCDAKGKAFYLFKEQLSALYVPL